jgi:glycosyltransferase involved in cell wall biosynthesis
MTAAHDSLLLFLSQGKSLEWWRETGLLSREIALYLRLLRENVFREVVIFSYDPADRALVADQARHDPLWARIRILAPERRATGRRALWWSLVGPLRHAREIGGAHAIKTNQLNSAPAALVAARRTGRPLVLRFGYLLSSSYHDSGRKLRAKATRVLEGIGYRAASRVLVSSRDMERHVAGRGYGAKVLVTPTYVDVATFRAKTDYDFSAPLVWVGRLSAAKNLDKLIEACALVGCDLTLIGSGELEEPLRVQAATVPIRVEFAGRMPNELLAERLRDHSVFMLPSFYEGLPKALIEAMACGLVCVASNVSGITDLLRDGDTGYLIDGFEAEDIARVLRRVFGEADGDVGRRARAFIERDFGLERYAEREAEVYASL